MSATIINYVKAWALASVIFVITMVALAELAIQINLWGIVKPIFEAMVNGNWFTQLSIFFIAQLFGFAFAVAIWYLARWAERMCFRNDEH